MRLFSLLTAIFFVLGFWSNDVRAASGGGIHFGGLFGIVNADQGDMNELISEANAASTNSVSDLGNAWELVGIFGWQFSGSSLSWQLRPSYFFQSEDGTDAASNKLEFSVNAFSLFQVMRWHMLEDQAIKFFSQFGVGFAMTDGEIREGSASVEFSGFDVGFLAGLGAEFCFFGGNHCMNVEGNVRFLRVARNIVDSVSGTFTNVNLTNSTLGQELEIDNEDLAISLSGIQGLIGYVFHF